MPKTEKILQVDSFGSRLQKVRIAKGMKRMDLYSAILGDKAIEPNNMDKVIRNWEYGKNSPSVDCLEKICELLDCDAEYLWGKISQPTHAQTDIVDKTGLSPKAIEKIVNLHNGESDNTHKRIDILSAFIESDKFDSLIEGIYHGLQVKENNIISEYRENDITYYIPPKLMADTSRFKANDAFNQIVNEIYKKEEKEWQV